jgi:hypothetical protein
VEQRLELRDIRDVGRRQQNLSAQGLDLAREPLAIARPMPCDGPVTIAILPASPKQA